MKFTWKMKESSRSVGLRAMEEKEPAQDAPSREERKEFLLGDTGHQRECTA
jgi:hypothetical protein